jgi:hypothetical protein
MQSLLKKAALSVDHKPFLLESGLAELAAIFLSIRE